MIDTFSIRCNILRLAFSGKLSEQRIADGNARSLLSRISSKKSVEQTENTPYEIPITWAWVKLADLYTINPKVDADDDTEAAFIPMERVNAGFDRTFSFERQSWVQASKNHTKFSDGDIAFAKISPCFENRKSFIAQDLPNGIGGGTTELIVLRQREMLPEYTYYLVLDQRFIDTGKASYKGTVGQQRVQSDVIKNFFVPVPPYPEQRRIVARIEQVFSALDTIDALQAKYADNLAVLKSKLIDAAIRGKLTEQRPEDGTAEDLYRRIQAEKQALVKAGKIKKEKPLPEIATDEVPFEIPANWKWIRLGAYCQKITDQVASGSFAALRENVRSLKTPDYAIMVKTADFSNGFTKNLTYTDKHGYDFLSNSNLFGGELILSNVGSVGKCFIVPKLSCKMTLAPNAVMVRMMEQSSKEYFYYFLISFQGYKELDAISTGVAVKKFNKTELKTILIPLPPLAEQKRIVAKLEELLPLCESSRNVQ